MRILVVVAVYGERPRACLAVVDDRDDAGSWRRCVDRLARQPRELGQPTTHVRALGIVADRLERRVEDPEPRLWVRPRRRRPLPAAVVAGRIAVDEVLHEVLLRRPASRHRDAW